jgi:two-component system OmpR family sensor kinase
VSLRARLLGATVLAALLALGIVDVATYTLVTRAQLQQVDQDLERSHPPIERAASAPVDDAEDAIRQVAPASYVELRDVHGADVVAVPLRRPGEPALRLPDLGLAPRRAGKDDAAVFRTVHAASGEAVRVRVSAQGDGGILIIGQTLGAVESTRHRLLWVLGLGTAGALVAVALVGRWLVGLGLVPLRAMEDAAEDISDEDLERRVPVPAPGTEVGRLATTLNTMLDRLHDAFRQRERDLAAVQASEARMRRFVADASHELRTPLAATAAYAELFERGARERPEDLERAMRGIRTETARMSELVDDLLLLAQLDEGRPLDRADVDLAELAAEAVHAGRVVAPERPLTLQVDDVVLVRGDGRRLRQVLDNLLANVRSHTPPGTAAEVRVRRDGPDAVLAVRDHGPGLPAAELEQVTERFYRADTSRARSSGGTGLGLAIVSAIVEAHGGRVSVEAADGGGLRILVRLPLGPEPEGSR